MTVQILTPGEAAKLKEILRQAEAKTTQVIRDGFESGAGQDGHHDEGYQLSKSQSAIANTRVTQLTALLNTARIVVPVEQSLDIRLGNSAIIRVGNEQRKVILCGYGGLYENPDFVSISSPLGRALLGKQAGDAFEVSLPMGLMELEVIQIFPPSANDFE